MGVKYDTFDSTGTTPPSEIKGKTLKLRKQGGKENTLWKKNTAIRKKERVTAGEKYSHKKILQFGPWSE